MHITLVPYLNSLASAFLRLLGLRVGQDGPVKSYMQQQAVTILVIVADESEGHFGCHNNS